MGKCYIEMAGIVHDRIIVCCVKVTLTPMALILYGHDSGSKTSLYGHIRPKAGPYPGAPMQSM